MPTGYEMLGAAIGGDSEAAYQEGRFMGARTEEALANARARVDENQAREQLAASLEATGLIPASTARASADALRAGANLGDVIALAGKQQELDFRAIAGSADPTVDAGARNRALAGVASGPVEPFKAVGSRGYQDIFAPEKGVMPLGAAGGTTNPSGQIQLLEAFGLLDENGRITNMELASDVIRRNQTIFQGGGVPYTLDVNPFRDRGGPAPLGDAVAPPPRAVAPPPAAAPPPRAVAPTSAAVSPNQVAQNVSTLAAAKEVGQAQGQARAELPKVAVQLRNTVQEADLVQGLLKQSLTDTNRLTAGIAGWATRNIPNTPAFDLAKTIDTIKANVGFRGLKQMRYESPTGGALGQVAVLELQFLQAALGNLDTAQDPTQLVDALKNVDAAYEKYRANALADFQAAQAAASGDFTRAADITLRVLQQYPDMFPTGVGGASQSGASPAGDNIPTVNSPQEAMALPSGTRFRTPDGRVKVRP